VPLLRAVVLRVPVVLRFVPDVLRELVVLRFDAEPVVLRFVPDVLRADVFRVPVVFRFAAVVLRVDVVLRAVVFRAPVVLRVPVVFFLAEVVFLPPVLRDAKPIPPFARAMPAPTIPKTALRFSRHTFALHVHNPCTCYIVSLLSAWTTFSKRADARTRSRHRAKSGPAVGRKELVAHADNSNASNHAFASSSSFLRSAITFCAMCVGTSS
jgi:hypothetical protein